MHPVESLFLFANKLVSHHRLHTLLSLMILFTAVAAQAQVTFNGVQTTPVTGLGAPQGLAVDQTGNLYIADSSNGRIVEQPVVGGPLNVLATGLSDPCAVALDGADRIYFSLGNQSDATVQHMAPVIFKMPAGGGAPTTIPFDYSNAVSTHIGVDLCGLAVDSAGDVFWTDLFNGVVEGVTWTGTAWGPFSLITGSGITPQSVAFDATNDLFYADSGTGRIEENPAARPAGDLTTFASGLSSPWGVAINPTGNVFASAQESKQVVEYPVGGGAPTVVPFTDLGTPTGVAVDARGGVFVADQANNQVLELETTSVNLGSLTLRGTYMLKTLSFNIAAGTVVRSIAVLTAGAANQDFFNTSGTTCATGTAAQATTCLVDVAFFPQASGVRQGAVVFYGASGQVLFSVPIYGIGTGPQNAYEGPTPVTLSAGGAATISAPAVAVDGAGDLFVSTDQGAGSVIEYPVSGSSYRAGITIATNLEEPAGVAVDGAGNVFVSDPVSSAILEIPLTSSGYGQFVTVASNLNSPNGIAVDEGGNLFFTSSQSVMEVPLGPTGYESPITVSSNVPFPSSIAVDAEENLYVTTSSDSSGTPGTGSVVEIPFLSNPAGYGPPVQLTENLVSPSGIWLEPSGSLVFSTYSNASFADNSGTLNYLPRNNPGTGFGSPVTLASSLSYPTGIAGDILGNIYFINSDSGQVMSLPRGTAPTLSFSPAPVGEVSSQTQVVTVRNIGTTLLDFSAITYPASFPESANGVSDGDCFATEGLEPGTSCPLTITFKPATVGAVSGSLNLTDNSLNFSNVTQSISLSGTGAAPAVSLSPASLSFGSETVGVASNSQSVTMTNTGTGTLSITSIAVTGTDASSFVFANSCGSSLAAGANCSIHGHFAPTTGGALTAAITITDNAGNSPQSIALSGKGVAGLTLSATSLSFASTIVGEASASQSVTVTNSTSAAVPIGSIAVTGTNASSFVIANSCGTSLAAGANCSIHGHFAPTATGALKAAVTISYTGTGSPQSIALSGTGLVGPVTLSAISISFGSLDVGTTSGSQSVTVTNTGTAALSITSIVLTGADASYFVFANTCGTSLAVGANCTIHGHFAPTVPGALTASIKITDSASTSPQTIALSGTGLGPAVFLSATTLSFGTEAVGTASTSKTVTLTNSGNGPLTITSITVTGADASSFDFANTCGATLAAGAACTIHGHFAPSTSGALTAAITITDNAANSPQTIALTGTGQ